MPGELPPWLDGGRQHAPASGPVTPGDAADPTSGRTARPDLGRRNLHPEGRLRLTVLVVGCAAAIFGVVRLWPAGTAARARQGGGTVASAPGAPAGTAGTLPAATFTPAAPPPAWAGALPYPVLIADSGQHRLLLVTPDKRVVWQDPAAGQQATVAASSVSFSPDGASVIATGQQDSVLQEISLQTGAMTWSYGTAGQPGSGPGQLNHPFDGHLLANGNVVVADVRNCRLLTLDPGGHIADSWGKPQSSYCQTNLAAGLVGYPGAAAPEPGGDLLVTLGSGSRVALLGPDGKPVWDVPAPTLYGATVATARMADDGSVVLAGLGDPGAVVAFNPKTRALLWEYHVTSGDGALKDPTDAEPLPNGNVLVTDSGNNRVVVIDPKSGTIVWQLGGTNGGLTLSDPTGAAIDYWRDWQAWAKAHQAKG